MAVVRPLADMHVSPTAALFEGRKHADIDLSFFVTSTPPGGGPGLHVHPYAEAFLVQEGTATFTAGDEEFVVTEGHVVVVPPETPHRYENRGESTLRQVSIHPSGEVHQTWLEDD
jgi:mannose-6-phosphate isomerase-like protein (cupin superfamily)